MKTLMKIVICAGSSLRAFALLVGVVGLIALSSKANAAPELPKVPTTRIIAIGHLTSKATPAAVAKVLPEEVRQTVELHLAGKIDQWFVRNDQNGVVFLFINVDVAEARALLDRLPLGQAGLMDFDLIPVGPLSPLSLLIAPHSK